jgi:hypothetical protein
VSACCGDFLLAGVAPWAVLLGIGLYSFTRRTEWLAVPGGLVVRRGARFRSQWDLHLFDRRKAVLLLIAPPAAGAYQRSWLLIVADEHTCKSRFGAQAEVEGAARAWLSPLPPPSVAQLSDLR